MVLGEAVIRGRARGVGGGWLAAIHTGLNRKEWFFLCPLAVMLIECFILTECCVPDLLIKCLQHGYISA